MNVITYLKCQHDTYSIVNMYYCHRYSLIREFLLGIISNQMHQIRVSLLMMCKKGLPSTDKTSMSEGSFPSSPHPGNLDLMTRNWALGTGLTYSSRRANCSRFLSLCFWCMQACRVSGMISRTLRSPERRLIQEILLANTKVRPGYCIRK